MLKILLGFILGIVICILLRRWWLAWQKYELECLAGMHLKQGIYCSPNVWTKRFKYVHNFFIETRLQLSLQLGYLKKDFLKLCLKHNILGFKATPLGEFQLYTKWKISKTVWCSLWWETCRFEKDAQCQQPWPLCGSRTKRPESGTGADWIWGRKQGCI